MITIFGELHDMYQAFALGKPQKWNKKIQNISILVSLSQRGGEVGVRDTVPNIQYFVLKSSHTVMN